MFVLDMSDDIYNPVDFVKDVSPCSPLSFLILFLVLMVTLSFPFRMVGDDDDEGALSDSDGHTGLAPDDLASK